MTEVFNLQELRERVNRYEAARAIYGESMAAPRAAVLALVEAVEAAQELEALPIPVFLDEVKRYTTKKAALSKALAPFNPKDSHE